MNPLLLTYGIDARSTPQQRPLDPLLLTYLQNPRDENFSLIIAAPLVCVAASVIVDRLSGPTRSDGKAHESEVIVVAQRLFPASAVTPQVRIEHPERLRIADGVVIHPNGSSVVLEAKDVERLLREHIQQAVDTASRYAEMQQRHTKAALFVAARTEVNQDILVYATTCGVDVYRIG